MGLLDFGGKPIVVKSVGAADYGQVLDIGLYFGSMTLLLNLLNLEKTGTPSFVLTMETAMDPYAKEWVSLGSFASLSGSATQDKQTFSNLLRYVRWNVSSMTNVTSATFLLGGVARNP